jgi:hypothetical protein
VNLANKDSNYSCEFRLTVHDGTVDSVPDTVTVNITATNDAPSLTVVSDKTVNENETLNFYIGVNDPDTSSVALSAEDASNTFAEAAVNIHSIFVDNGNNTGNFFWTPNFQQAGNYTLTVVAFDGTTRITELINITVVDVNPGSRVDHVIGNNHGPGIIQLIDAQGQTISSWQAFPSGGVRPYYVPTRDGGYIFAVSHQPGRYLKVFDVSANLIIRRQISPHVHWRTLTAGQLDADTSTIEVVLGTTRSSRDLYFKYFQFDTLTEQIRFIRRARYAPVLHRRYSLSLAKPYVVLRRFGKIFLLWKPAQ